MKLRTLTILTFLLIFISQMNADRYIKIASIDFGYIFKKYTATKTIRKKIDRLRKKVKNFLDKDRRQLKQLIKDYKRKKYKYTEMQKRWYYSKIKIKRFKLIQKMNYYRARLKKIERRLTLDFIREIYLAAKKIARKKGFSIVVRKNVILHADERHNLTQFVLNYLERKLRGERRE
jgi:Skp family chaperone for outer membrane proteins